MLILSLVLLYLKYGNEFVICRIFFTGVRVSLEMSRLHSSLQLHLEFCLYERATGVKPSVTLATVTEVNQRWLKRSGYCRNLGSLRAGTRHHGDFSVMGTSSLQPFLKSYWLTPVK